MGKSACAPCALEYALIRVGWLGRKIPFLCFSKWGQHLLAGSGTVRHTGTYGTELKRGKVDKRFPYCESKRNGSRCSATIWWMARGVGGTSTACKLQPRSNFCHNPRAPEGPRFAPMRPLTGRQFRPVTRLQKWLVPFVLDVPGTAPRLSPRGSLCRLNRFRALFEVDQGSVSPDLGCRTYF